MTQALGSPVERLALVVKRPSNKGPTPAPERPGGTAIIRYNARNSAHFRVAEIDRQKFFNKSRLEIDVVIEKEADFPFRGIHPPIAGYSSAGDTGFADVTELRLFSSKPRSAAEESFNALLTFVTLTLVNDDHLPRQHALTNEALNRKHQIFRAVFGRYDDCKRREPTWTRRHNAFRPPAAVQSRSEDAQCAFLAAVQQDALFASLPSSRQFSWMNSISTSSS